jgi:hypothetical protein
MRNVELTRHDRLAGSGIVSQDKAQRLPGKQRFIDRGDLVRQRLDVRGVNRHHRIEEEGEVDPFGLAGQLKGGTVAVERKGPLRCRDTDELLVERASRRSFITPSGLR